MILEVEAFYIGSVPLNVLLLGRFTLRNLCLRQRVSFNQNFIKMVHDCLCYGKGCL